MATYPVVRLSKGHFEAANYAEVRRLAEAEEAAVAPSLKQLRGLIYYSAGVDPVTNTFINISIWTDMDAAKQMNTLPAMLAHRPIMEQAGVQFDRIANYEPIWALHATELKQALGSSISFNERPLSE